MCVAAVCQAARVMRVCNPLRPVHRRIERHSSPAAAYAFATDQSTPATLDSGVGDCTISLDLVIGGSPASVLHGVAFRGTAGSDYWFAWIRADTNKLALYNRASGTSNFVTDTDYMVPTSTTVTMTVVLSGTSISVTMTGGANVSTTSSTRQTATLHGLMNAGTGDAGANYDNFQIDDGAGGGSTFTATGSPSLGAQTCAGVGLRWVKGSGSPSLGAQTCTGAGKRWVKATGTPSLGSQVMASSGTMTAPRFTATGAPSLGSETASGSGTRTVPVFTGSGSPSLAAKTMAASGSTVTTRTGTGSPSLAAKTMAATGTRTVPVFTGSGNPSFGAMTCDGASTQAVYVAIDVQSQVTTRIGQRSQVKTRQTQRSRVTVGVSNV